MNQPRSICSALFRLSRCVAVALSVGGINLPARSLSTPTATLPPKIALLQPVNGAVFTNPAEIQIMAEASDADGSVRSVELFTDVGSLGSLTMDPAVGDPISYWKWTWSDPSAGDHKLVARATDNDGAITYSESVVITVRRQTNSTTASLVIVKPTDGATFSSNAAVVSIEVTAVDALADIRHVEFFANDLSIGRSDQWTKEAVIPGKPREHFLDWKPLEGGNYTLTAKASDSLGALVVSKPVTITVGPQLPAVSLEATVETTAEPGPTIRIRPGVFTLKRTGLLDQALTVSLLYEGSATPNLDYQPLPEVVIIPAGAPSTELLVAPIEDSLDEGVETVSAQLVNPPDGLAGYVIDPEHSAAKVLIYDSTSPTAATLEITAPKEGELLELGQTIMVNATAIDPAGYIASVEFYDFENKLGTSQLAFFRAPDPGTPIYHSIEWQDAAPGAHSLTARAMDSSGNQVISKAVAFKVATDASLPVVQITALDPSATELSPLVEVIDPARFSISRDGDLSRDLLVAFSLHGTAEAGKDYKLPDRFVKIPAGEREATVDIVPLPDDLAEPMKTIAIRLEDPLPISSLPAPPTPYTMSLLGREAVAVIYDRRPPENGAVELALPSNGDVYPSSMPIVLMAAASHPTVDLSHVDFYAGDQLIGSSDVVVDKATSGGLIVHRFEWKEPLPGDQVISARAKLPDGTELISSLVHVTIKGADPTSILTLLRPQSGAVFGEGESVEIGAVARDPNGPTQKLEILVDDRVVDSTTASELATKVSDLGPGPHVLVARAIDSRGTEVLSEPVKILIWSADKNSSSGAAGPAEVKNIARQSNGNVRLQLTGPVNGLCQLEVSSDLVNWAEAPPLFLPDGQIVVDEDAKNGPTRRFYRIRSK